MAWLGISEAVAAFAAMDKRVDVAAMDITHKVGAAVEAAAKNNFVGAHRRNERRVPNAENKPNIVTGTLRRSIRSTPTARIAGGYTTTVGPTVVYGRRVELGFKGTDARGRRYNQPAYSYFGPGVKDVRLRAREIALVEWAAATH